MNVYMLLDRSGSMENLWDEAIGSINGYVEALPGDTNVMLALFDSISYDVIRNTTARNWDKVGKNEYSPRAGTPLFDAAARMMQRVLDDNPRKAIFVTMTDGEENQSQNFEQKDVKDLTAKLKAKDYEVIFLGANFDKVGEVAKSFGVQDQGKFMRVAPRRMEDTMRAFAGSSAIYASASVGAGAINFSDEDKAKAGA